MASYKRGAKLLQKSPGDAMQEFGDAVASYDQNHAAHFGLGLLFSSKAESAKDPAVAKTEWKQAEAEFVKAAASNENDPMYHFKAGRAQFELARFEAAKASFRKAIELNDQLYKAHYYLGKTLISLGKFKEGATSVSKAIELEPSYEYAIIYLGQTYISWDYYDEAIELLKNNRENINKRSSQGLRQANYDLGFAYFLKKDYSNAAAAFGESLKADKNFAPALVKRGICRVFSGNKKGAADDLKKALDSGKLKSHERIQALKYQPRDV